MFGFFRRSRTPDPRSGKGGHAPQRSRDVERSIAEMLQLIRRVLADGVVTEEEAGALSAWTKGHPEVVEAWPGKVLVHRLERIFEDGKVDEEERKDLQRLLRSLASGGWGIRDTHEEGPGGVPLTRPFPLIVFPEQVFVFAGDFAFGPVSVCREAVVGLGGRVQEEVEAGVDILVVGTFGARDWQASPEAGKIESALRLRREGAEVAIVSEDWWAAALPEPTR